MEESEQNNPAGRLHEILARAQEHASTSGVIGHAGVFWASVFDIPTQPRVPTVSGPALYEVISRLLQLEKLIKETEQALSRILGLPDVISGLSEGFAQSPHNPLPHWVRT